MQVNYICLVLMLLFIISVMKIGKFNYQLPSGTKHMWIAY